MIKVGVIGRGLAGTVFHAPLIRAVDGMELAAIVGSAGAHDLLIDDAIDLIIVATPNSSHFELAKLALENGKHVVIDKPFVTSTREADILIALAAERNRMLTVFHNRRWDGDFLTVRDQIASGNLGDVTLYQAYWDRFRPTIKDGWKELPTADTGLLWDLGPHLIDQMIVLFGMPDAVDADIAAQRPGALVDDYFSLTFTYRNARVILGASTLVAQPRPRFALHGTNGSFVKYGVDSQEAALREGDSPLATGFGIDPADFHGSLVSASGTVASISTIPGRYLGFYEGVVEAIDHDRSPPVDPKDARTVISIIEAARLSSSDGRRVKLPAN